MLLSALIMPVLKYFVAGVLFRVEAWPGIGHMQNQHGLFLLEVYYFKGPFSYFQISQSYDR